LPAATVCPLQDAVDEPQASKYELEDEVGGVGGEIGLFDGRGVGAFVGRFVGRADGAFVGGDVGLGVGTFVGKGVGFGEGAGVTGGLSEYLQ
jgi:hypothetical protein